MGALTEADAAVLSTALGGAAWPWWCSLEAVAGWCAPCSAAEPVSRGALLLDAMDGGVPHS